jgi:hypothetical protein
MLAAAALAPTPDVLPRVTHGSVDYAADELASVRLGAFRPADERPFMTPAADFGESRAAVKEADRGYAYDVEAPPIVPVDLDEERPRQRRERLHVPPPQDLPGVQDIESIAARRAAANRSVPRWPLSRLHSGDVVRALPQTASFYSLMGLPVNLRGLVFDNVATASEQHEGVPILVVEGNVVNQTRKTEDVPRLKFVLRNAARQEIYSWTAVPARATLPPGEGVEFHSRLASPPADARDVVVRFVNRRDVIAASR